MKGQQRSSRMRRGKLAATMAVVVDRLLNARESSIGLDRAIETIVATMGQFNVKDVTSYLEAYMDEMIMRDIQEGRRLGSFSRFVAPSIHAEVLEIQMTCRSWEELEERLLQRYGLEDSLRLSMKDLMDWVEIPGTGRKTSVFLQEFKKRFAWLSTVDRACST